MKFKTPGNIIQWYVLFIWATAMLLGLLFFDKYGLFLYLGLLMMIAPLPLAFVFGRVYCGWLCPMGAVLDLIIAKISREKKMPKILNSNFVRVILIISMPASMLLIALKIGSLNIHGAILGPILIGMMGMFAIAMIMGVLFRHRSWCNICPVGTVFSVAAKTARYDLVRNDNCNACGLCKKVCPLDGKTWKDNKRAGAECMLCRDCEVLCPKGAIELMNI